MSIYPSAAAACCAFKELVAACCAFKELARAFPVFQKALLGLPSIFVREVPVVVLFGVRLNIGALPQ